MLLPYVPQVSKHVKHLSEYRERAHKLEIRRPGTLPDVNYDELEFLKHQLFPLLKLSTVPLRSLKLRVEHLSPEVFRAIAGFFPQLEELHIEGFYLHMSELAWMDRDLPPHEYPDHLNPSYLRLDGWECMLSAMHDLPCLRRFNVQIWKEDTGVDIPVGNEPPWDCGCTPMLETVVIGRVRLSKKHENQQLRVGGGAEVQVVSWVKSHHEKDRRMDAVRWPAPMFNESIDGERRRDLEDLPWQYKVSPHVHN